MVPTEWVEWFELLEWYELDGIEETEGYSIDAVQIDKSVQWNVFSDV